ncbi:efflux RND transporter periplasmic adaptor subunit, partial [Xanthomonas hortorum pv. carotae]|nr:efflux RND transporter periplasmic adaptor subunit [Xanthomonas hortorum pv. carotae]
MSRFWKITLLVVAVLVVVFVAMRMFGGGNHGKRAGAPDGSGTEDHGPVPVTVVAAT